MDGKKILKFLISFLIIIQVLSFVFKIDLLNAVSKITLSISIPIFYCIRTAKIKIYHLSVIMLFAMGDLIVLTNFKNTIRYDMVIHIVGYVLLFYFLYYNHRSFEYNSRDVFTLVLGSLLYTVIFVLTYTVLKTPMGDINILGFLLLLLLYVLLIVAAMHYINTRSEKSLWFFLAILNFAFSDFMLLLNAFYVQSYELQVLMLLCTPMAWIFLVNYMITKPLKLKAEEFDAY